MHHFRALKSAVFAVSLAVGVGVGGMAQAANDYPDNTITFIVPFGAGSATDTLGRLIAEELSKELNNPVVVQNRAGAGGNIGAAQVAEAKPDGYTLLMTAASTASINHHLFDNIQYDPIEDFAPITNIAKTANVLVATPSIEADTVEELIELSKNKRLTFASSGSGGSMHLSGEMFKAMSGGDLRHVAYNGSGEALADLLPGRVQLMFCNVPVCLPHINSGKLKALAVTTAERSSLLPDVPTVDETGLEGYEVSGWFGLFAPAETDSEIVELLNEKVTAILNSDEVIEKLQAQGATPDPLTTAEFAAFVQAESDKWGKVIEEANITLGK